MVIVSGIKLWKIREGTRRSAELQDVQAGVSSIDDVNISAVVNLHIVGLDHPAAALRGAASRALLVRFIRHRRNKIRNFLRMKRIPHIDSPHARIEVRKKHNALVVDRGETFVRRMRPKTSAAAAKVSASLRYC